MQFDHESAAVFSGDPDRPALALAMQSAAKTKIESLQPHSLSQPVRFLRPATPPEVPGGGEVTTGDGWSKEERITVAVLKQRLGAEAWREEATSIVNDVAVSFRSSTALISWLLSANVSTSKLVSGHEVVAPCRGRKANAPTTQ